jgi:SAM-dependent MidA family methyltransferase
MAVPFDEYQRERNEEFYKKKGAEFRKEFKTFAADVRFARALATDFFKRMKEEKTINVYEFGIGGGSLGTRFLIELRKLSESLAEKTVYHFCDFSEELVRNATKRADSFGFNADGIVYDAVKDEPKFLVDANYVLMSEFYDDLPAKILVREGKDIMEVVIEEKEKRLEKFKGAKELVDYMGGMPEGYHIPVNIVAKKHLDYCASKIKGYIDVFDYGFVKGEIKEMPAEMWNNSIVREFGGQITTDVNFDFVSGGLNAKIETQLEFIERVLGKKLHEIETDRLRYLTDEEIKKSGKELGKYGYTPGSQEEVRESRGYLHMRVE